MKSLHDHDALNRVRETNRVLTVGIIAAAAVALSAGCAPKRPVLYPNRALVRAGAPAGEQAIDECTRLARAAGYRRNTAKDVAGEAAKGAAVGATVGAVTGAVRGRPGEYAATGAAGAGTGGILHELFRSRDPDPFEKSYVEHCLHDRGYSTLGWK